MLKFLFLASRPKQWTKNLIIFFPAVFTVGNPWETVNTPESAWVIGQTCVAFVLFSILSSSVYLVNDVFDIDSDREHPTKRLRPVASNCLSPKLAFTLASGLAFISIGLAFLLMPLFGWIMVGYLILMTTYSVGLKRIVLLDVLAISGGFVLRAIAGVVVLQVPVSPWLYTCTGLGALFIALAKRRSELVTSVGVTRNHRSTLAIYTLPLLDQLIVIAATSTLLAYTLYTFTADNLPENHAMMATIPFVTYGLFRYLFLVYARNRGENPEQILITDIPLIATICLWLGTAWSVLLLFR